jgi:16S rRNA (cytosine967-C5)-methyltransferase
MPVSPARAAAFDILLRVEKEAAYASELLHSKQFEKLSPPDHGLATELVMGVLRWRSVLDARLSPVSSQTLAKLDVEVLTSLRLGTYQLGWLDRVPARAAIFESVELVKRARKRSAATFVNAVLRKLGRSAPRTSEPLLKIEEAQTAAELSERGSHPAWLVERWAREFGMETARRICAHNQRVPETTIRLRDKLAEADLKQEGIELAAGAFLASARRVLAGDVTNTRVFSENRITIQDEASQLVAALVGHGKRILDGCAAPGGKTWAIADRNPESTIVAVELHANRAELVRKRIAAPSVEVIASDLQQLPVGELFDRVLVDVPCSGTGTLARHPEIKWRLRPEDIDDLRARQLAILHAAMRQVSQHGRLVYSTCSLEREEDEVIVEQALAANNSFRLLDCRAELERLRNEGGWTASDFEPFLHGRHLRTIPGVQRCDGFFAAIFEKF